MYLGFMHYDWSYLERWFKISEVDTFTMLRDPVDRAISHFNFHRLMVKNSNDTFANMTLSGIGI